MTCKGRFDSRQELVRFVWNRWLHTPSNTNQIARAARVSDAVVSRILSQGVPMVDAEYLVPGATIKHDPTGGEYTVLSNTLKLRDREGSWFDAVRYRNEKGEEFVRAVLDFSSFTLVAGARPFVDSSQEAAFQRGKRRGYTDGYYAGKLASMDLLRRCLPIVQYDAQMMADITRHAPLAPEDQAKHNSTEYESEKLVREIPLLLSGELGMINEYEASPEFQLEQPHPTADERAACDEITKAARRGALSLVVCPGANAWIPLAEHAPQPGETIIKRWGDPNITTVMRIEKFAPPEKFNSWAPIPPNGPQRVVVLAAVLRHHDEVMYLPVARLLDGSEWLGQPALDSPYITADNRSPSVEPDPAIMRLLQELYLDGANTGTELLDELVKRGTIDPDQREGATVQRLGRGEVLVKWNDQQLLLP